MSPLWRLLGLPFLLLLLLQVPPAASQTYVGQCELDLVILVDSSYSIGQTNFTRLLGAVMNYINTLPVAPVAAHVGVVGFSSILEVIPITSNLTRLRQLVPEITFQAGVTNSFLAFDQAYNTMMAQNALRPSASKAVIIITDGVSREPPRSRAAANKLRGIGVGIWAIGIGNNVNVLELFYYTQDINRVKRTASFSVLPNMQLPINCQVIPPTTTTSTTTTTTVTTSTATTTESTTEASTTESTTEASTTESTTEGSTTESTTGASTTESTTGASTTESTTGASTSESTTAAPSTDNTTSAPSTDNTTSAPTTESTTAASTTDNTTSAPTTINTTSASTTDNTTVSSTTENSSTAATTVETLSSSFAAASTDTFGSSLETSSMGSLASTSIEATTTGASATSLEHWSSTIASTATENWSSTTAATAKDHWNSTTAATATDHWSSTAAATATDHWSSTTAATATDHWSSTATATATDHWTTTASTASESFESSMTQMSSSSTPSSSITPSPTSECPMTSSVTPPPHSNHEYFPSTNPGSLCHKAIMKHGFGFAPHPSKCDMYIQCYQAETGHVTASVRLCPRGLFWYNQNQTCVSPRIAQCHMDPCKNPQLQNYRMAGGCGLYWTCQNGVSYGRYCPPNHAYTTKKGCVYNTHCQGYKVCEDENQGACYAQPLPGNHGYKTLLHNDLYWFTTPCLYGATFDLGTCSCEVEHQFSPGCPFIEKFHVYNGFTKAVPYGSHQVKARAGSARPVTLRFQYKASNETSAGAEPEVIVRSSECESGGLFVVSEDAGFLRASVLSKCGFGMSSLLPLNGYNASEWRDVAINYSFDGDLSMTVTSGSLTYTSNLQGGMHVPIGQCGWTVGRPQNLCRVLNPFEGDIQQIYLSRCYEYGF